MEDNNEKWADVYGFENYYEVSTLGNARSKDREYINNQGQLIRKRGKILKPIIGKDGYIRYGLKKPNDTKVYKVFAHRMVAMAFIPKIANMDVVGHKDDVRDNNRVENLYWTDNFENMQKAQKSGRTNFNGIKDANSVEVIAEKDGEHKVFKSYSELANHLKCSVANVSSAISNGHVCCGYYLERINIDKGRDEIIIESDDMSNIPFGAKPIIIKDSNGKVIFARSIVSASQKLGRSYTAISEAIEKGYKCNDCTVEYYNKQ